MRVSSGIAGLDHVLGGGFPYDRVYLIEGDPGSGKTTLGLQFLREGLRRDEKVLYVTLSETLSELTAVAESHGWTLDGMAIHELSTSTDKAFKPDDQYTFFHPSEVELGETTKAVLAEVERVNPTRVVFDSLSEMRLLAREPLRYRRQILGLKQFFVGRRCTVLLLDDRTSHAGDLQLQSLAHGVVALEQLAPEYGAERRRLRVKKVRGVKFRGGFHDFRIVTGGIEVYPRVLQEEPRVVVTGDSLSSGSKALDTLLGGGLTCGTSTLITGAAGTGKSVLCTQFARAEIERGKRVLFYLFDERMSTFRLRSAGLGMDMDAATESGQLRMTQVEPTELSPGEFASQVVRAVEGDKCSLVIIDSINGYMQSMPEERLLPIQIHELLSFLSNNGVTCIMTLVQHGIFGNPVDEAVDVSYLADTVILMRYFEVSGTVRQAISVVKKRSSDHERTIRECKVQRGGLFVGEPLRDFQGVLTGVPHYVGASEPLLEQTDGSSRAALAYQSNQARDQAEDGVAEHGRKRTRSKSRR